MNKYRSLENIIRDVSAGKLVSEKMGIIATIKNLGRNSKKPAEGPLASEPQDKTIAPEKADGPKETPKEQPSTLSAVLTPGTPEHAAHVEYAKRAQRKLKIIDKP
jgi:hypothetical protein